MPSHEPLGGEAAREMRRDVGTGTVAVINTSSDGHRLLTMSATATAFQVTNVLDAYEGDRRVFARTWHREVPRDCV